MNTNQEPGKLRIDLIEASFIFALAEVLTHGAEKHGENNWRTVEAWRPEFYSAAMRHILRWFQGEDLDQDSGLGHLDHAICNLYFLRELNNNSHVTLAPRVLNQCDTHASAGLVSEATKAFYEERRKHFEAKDNATVEEVA